MKIIVIIAVIVLALSIILSYVCFRQIISGLKNPDIKEEVKTDLIRKTLKVGNSFFIMLLSFLLITLIMYIRFL